MGGLGTNDKFAGFILLYKFEGGGGGGGGGGGMVR